MTVQSLASTSFLGVFKAAMVFTTATAWSFFIFSAIYVISCSLGHVNPEMGLNAVLGALHDLFVDQPSIT